jgi:hypothetical protein
MDLDIQDGILLINKAVEKDEEDKAFRMWLSIYPNMDEENFIPFSEYYEKITNRYASEVNITPTQELFDELDVIRKQFELPSPETELA